MLIEQLLIDAGRAALIFLVATSPGSRDEPVQTPGADGSFFLGTPTYAVTIKNLDPKRVPVEVRVDDDKKDFAVRGNRVYKPAKKDDEAGPPRQLLMRAKRDDAEVCVEGEFAYDGDFDQSVRFSIDGTKGLADGESLAFLEVLIKGETDTAYRVEAVWNEAINGFTTQALVGGVPMGTPHDYAGARRLLLFSSSLEGEFALASALAGFDVFSFEEYVQLFGTTLPVSGLPACGAFGAEGLDRGGAMFFADMALTGSTENLELTQAEKTLLAIVRQASVFAGNAEIFSDPDEFFGNMLLARDWANAAAGAYNFAELNLDDAAGTGTLTGKKLKLLKASIKRGKKSSERALARAQKLVDKGKGPGDTDRQTERQAQKGRNFADLASGQLLGLNSRSVDHVYDWFDW